MVSVQFAISEQLSKPALHSSISKWETLVNLYVCKKNVMFNQIHLMQLLLKWYALYRKMLGSSYIIPINADDLALLTTINYTTIAYNYYSDDIIRLKVLLH